MKKEILDLIFKSDIMVVDDNANNLRLLADLLKEKKFKVRPLPSGKLAINAARNQPPDLVLLDITMPEMDGYETCLEFKKIPELKEVPIIFISALDQVLDKVKAFDCGGVDFITKPYEPEEVFARLKNHLELKHARAELKKSNESLEKAVVELKKLNDEKDDLLSIAAHDLKNPASGISLSAKLIREGVPEDKQDGLLEQIVTASNGMLKLIGNLLDSNRIEHGEINVDFKNFDAKEVIERVINSYAPELEVKGQTVQFLKQTVASPIYADRDLTMQVMDNLLSNASKYSPLNSEILVVLYENDDEVYIEVEDEGPGIAEQEKHLLFKRFTRLSSMPTGNESSTGLGLSIVKKLVTLMHGHISCESEFGKGTRFIVRFPKRNE